MTTGHDVDVGYLASAAYAPLNGASGDDAFGWRGEDQRDMYVNQAPSRESVRVVLRPPEDTLASRGAVCDRMTLSVL